MVFSLGGIQFVSLPMFIALRRFTVLFVMIMECYVLRYGKVNTAKSSREIRLKLSMQGQISSGFLAILALTLFWANIRRIFYLPLRYNTETGVQFSVVLMMVGSLVAALDDLAFNLKVATPN